MPSFTKPQWDFLSDRTTPNLAFSGGMGAGKSFAGACKVLDLATLNQGHPGIVWAPRLSDAKEGVMRTVLRILRGDHESEFHVPYPYEYNKSTGYIVLWPDNRGGRETTILVRSGEQDIVGTNAAWALADELDTLSKTRARIAWQQLIQRVRVGNHRQLCATTTPEGFRFLWEFFVNEPKLEPSLAATRRLITASLLTNPNVDDDYINNLILSHTPEQQRARIHGEFVNLGSARVYEYYDRNVNGTSATLQDYPNADLWIGMDFNVGKMAAVVGVYLPNKLLILDELVGTKERPILDTPSMIRLLKARYPNRRIHICPDASGENRNANGWLTSIGELQQAGFTCHHDASNPRVGLRVANVNRMLFNVHQEHSPGLYVNSKYCPFVTEVFEQQPYNSKGEPDKDGDLDHCSDAVGYLVMQSFGQRLTQAANASWKY